jgi:hypothetical protein
MMPSIGGGLSTGGGAITGGTSGAKNGDFYTGGQGGRVTFNNNMGNKNNMPLYVLLGALVVMVMIWKK